MAKITLIGVDLAREGLEFTFVTPLVGCASCKIKNVCFNLEPGRNYRITKVRDKVNPCFVFNRDQVATVEVEEIQEYVNMQFGKKLQEGSTITLKSMNCDHITCPNIEVCNLVHKREGTKATIKAIEGRLECPKGYDMRRVSISIIQ
ncbi:hypothetical protein GCM10007108_07100 [Thermogymnomonas acidicola]|uniref:UPF0179 protein GCM10007108_07100 n=1 Tax=Thermogymnomonas acidicola TaxID=399579 RepID=A0AA37BQT9_9ARCH|nr:UPF0179 family protein [Thermogymnomonas acidicola]GGM71565.1 hypothetical protein GCM10007108_07100 [Thermogymnomonas acidicola]